MSVEPVVPVNTVSRVSSFQPGQQPAEKSGQEAKGLGRPAENQQPEGGEEMSLKEAKALADVLNKVSEFYDRQLRFDVFEETNRVYVQVIDKATKEVIKQIPPQEMLELSAKIKEMVGLFLDKYV
ncbi:MAG: flagellar protein FlaG [Peptococcaceae bacterium]|jgi:flagellar protein FlaG|nr:flagellar protein FlaG [Peptococcaceae bacterium]MDH7524776.1 flagellar protein FlaG [Peptococcaceae bacterium]